ncbi:hypothetical protein scyTo_0012525 [Scyliorhinus torazame]|uniref:Uncharacterized protein n=1 Tax=Scyliorhinus torazame TaxID=75743 RepID=A0A401PA55_SCYTO|nr:hypothetical protein [Scyliorhinus torazame]
MAHTAATDAKSVQTPEEQFKTQATALHTANDKKGSTERVVDLEDTGALESVKQCINTKLEVDRNKIFKAKPKAASKGKSTGSGGKCLLEKKHDSDINGCSSNIEQKCCARTMENKNERSEDQDKQEFEKHGKKSNKSKSTDHVRQTKNWHTVAYHGLTKENYELLELKQHHEIEMKELERTRAELENKLIQLKKAFEASGDNRSAVFKLQKLQTRIVELHQEIKQLNMQKEELTRKTGDMETCQQ